MALLDHPGRLPPHGSLLAGGPLALVGALVHPLRRGPLAAGIRALEGGPACLPWAELLSAESKESDSAAFEGEHRVQAVAIEAGRVASVG